MTYTKEVLTVDGKRFIMVMTLQPDFHLKFAERWAYACLLDETRRGRGVSLTRLSALTGLNRSRNLPGVLRTLERLELAHVADGQWWADQPSTSQAVYDRESNKEHWWERLRYFKVYRRAPGNALTPMQNAVYCLLAAKKPVRTRAGLSKILRINRTTVSRALAKLEALGLIDQFRRPLPLGAEKLLWWETDQRKAKRTEAWQEVTELFAGLIQQLEGAWPEHGWRQQWRTIVTACQGVGYKAKETGDLLADACNELQLLRRCGELLRAVPNLVKLAEQGTERNRRSGKWRGSSFGAFRAKVKDWVEDVKSHKKGVG